MNQLRGKLSESQTRTRYTVEDDNFMLRVDVQDIVERSRAAVGVQGYICARVVHLNWHVGPKAESYQKVIPMLL
jgi:hypothetical protein